MATAKTPTPKEATDWFIGKARSAAGYRKNITNNTERSRSNAVIGKIFFYWYDPKWKHKLPIYDRFPLVLPIERYSDGFLGLNLHYASKTNRILILGKLAEFANNKYFTEKTKLNLTYDLLKATTVMPLLQPCIKRYLFSHVRSRFIEVHADEWANAIALPVELFVQKT